MPKEFDDAKLGSVRAPLMETEAGNPNAVIVVDVSFPPPLAVEKELQVGSSMDWEVKNVDLLVPVVWLTVSMVYTFLLMDFMA